MTDDNFPKWVTDPATPWIRSDPPAPKPRKRRPPMGPPPDGFRDWNDYRVWTAIDGDPDLRKMAIAVISRAATAWVATRRLQALLPAKGPGGCIYSGPAVHRSVLRLGLPDWQVSYREEFHHVMMRLLVDAGVSHYTIDEWVREDVGNWLRSKARPEPAIVLPMPPRKPA